MAKFKKYKVKRFTIPEGKYIINSDKNITVQELTVEMKSIPQKRRKQRESKPPKWFKDFVENEFRPLVNRIDNLEKDVRNLRNDFNNVVKLNKLKTK